MEVLGFLNFPDESRGWMFRAALRARSVIRRFQPQVVVSSGPPHAAHLVARMATIGSALPWVIDMFRAFAPLLERLAVRAAQGVITTTSAFAEALAVKYPALPVVCIPNGVDAECLPPPARDRYPGLGIAYAGTLYAGRDLGPLVNALRIFLERHPAAAQGGSKLRIAGEAGAAHARSFYETIAAARMEQYVEVLGKLPRAQALDVVSRSRLAVVLAQEQELQVPAKLYESVAMGIPTLVVAPADSAAGVEGGRVGAVVRDPADVEGIACLLEQLWRDDSRRRSACPVPITYETIAPLVDQLLETRSPLVRARERVRTCS
jgi:glycosyltransferase involved in cell wall biosynthesis